MGDFFYLITHPIIYNSYMNIIEVKNLKKFYPLPKAEQKKRGLKHQVAVDDISFEVKEGEIFGLLGPNGAGKTTTLEIIETYGTADSGSVKVFGFDSKAEAKQVREIIGVQLQSSEYFPELTLTELISLFGSFYKSAHNSENLLEQVGLEEKTSNRVSELSGGQKQRFSIALALVNNPKVLFLDEPSTGLDPKTRRDLWGLIRKINEQGTTIVLTTHYMEEAELLCDRVAILDKGRILKIDQPERLISDIRNTTQVSFFTNSEISKDVLNGLPGVTKIYSTYPKTILEINSLDTVAGLFEGLKSSGVRPSGFTLKTASLEDVYLDLTGKEYLT